MQAICLAGYVVTNNEVTKRRPRIEGRAIRENQLRETDTEHARCLLGGLGFRVSPLKSVTKRHVWLHISVMGLVREPKIPNPEP